MDVTVAAPARSGRLARAAPVACCAAAGVAGVLVWRNDPAAPGSGFPACAFHSATGLWCPGCGLTRGIHALFNGHVGTALSSNVFTPVALVAIVWLLVSWLRTAWGRPALRLPQGAERALIVAGPVLVLGYGVLRNIPASPFRSLAP
ncbi:MAG: DUF2752 domain-containing protein [Ilumatobacteraceae bacterium]